MKSTAEHFIPYTVVVFDNGVPIQHYVIIIHEEDEVEAAVGGVDEDAYRSVAKEILQKAIQVANFYEVKPHLREMISNEIDRFREDRDGDEGEPPSPTQIADIPF